MLVECEGDASRAADVLEINQPSMSKRLAVLQHSNPLARHPWIEKRGKSWGLTPEGQRNLPAVRDIVRRSRNLQDDVDEQFARSPDLAVACGQMAAQTFVRDALLKFRKEFPEARVRLSTPRGKDRIQGVATGHFDLAVVTHGESEIARIAKRPLQTESLFEDPWCLVCSKKAPAAVRQQFSGLTAESGIAELIGLPLILPEPDAGMRARFDHSVIEAGVQDQLTVAMELGGWQNLLGFVKEGWGVGLISQNACAGERSLDLVQLKAGKRWKAEVRLVHRPNVDFADEPRLAWFTDLLRKLSPKG